MTILREVATLLSLRFLLLDRRASARSPLLRPLLWAMPPLLLWLAVGFVRGAETFAAALPPHVVLHGLVLLLAAMPLLLLADAFARASAGDGMAPALAHYPLSPTSIYVSETLMGAVSAPVLGGALLVLGALRGAGHRGAVLASLVCFGFLLGLQRLLRLLALRALRRRGVREIAMAVTSLAVFAGWSAFALASRDATANVFAALDRPTPPWLGLIPPGSLLMPAFGFEPLPALGLAALLACTFALGAALQADAATQDGDTARPRARRRGLGLLDRLPFDPLILAVAAKELRMLRRDPFLLSSLAVQTAVLVLPALLLPRHRGDAFYLPALVFLLVLSKQVPLMNLVGLEGRGMLFLASTPAPRWKVLVGKDVGFAALFALVDGIALSAACAIRGRLGDLPQLAALAVLGMLLLVAVGNVVSAMFPAAWIGARAAAGGPRAASAAAADGGVEPMGCLAGLGRFVAVQIVWFLLLPSAALLALARSFLPAGGFWAAWTGLAGLAALLLVAATAFAARRMETAEDVLLRAVATRAQG